jgi:anti-sigma factor RsiW
MGCGRRIERMWQAYLVGDQSDQELQAYKAHLQQCPACRARKELTDRSREHAVALMNEAPAMTEAEWARIRRAIQTPDREHPSWKLTLVLGTAVAVFLLVAGLWLANPGHTVSEATDGGLTNAAPEWTSNNPAPGPEPERYEVRLATSDPKVKVVWVFDRNLNLEL